MMTDSCQKIPDPGFASALDIGGTRARLYAIEQWQVKQKDEISLPQRLEKESLEDWGQRRVHAIADLISRWSGPLPGGLLPTACAGRKDQACESVVLSFYGSPLPDLVGKVREQTGVSLGRLLDDDVCAGWGHLVSPEGGLCQDSPDTILLTAGTGLAECLWVGSEFVEKGTFPRLAELGVEDSLRAEGWRDTGLPVEGLERLLLARSPLGSFQRMVLSGRFAGVSGWPGRLASGVELIVCPLEEAPALGALALSALGGADR
jgi:hypothetical protein